MPGLNGGGPPGTAAQFEVANGGGGIEYPVYMPTAGTLTVAVNIATLGLSPYSVTWTLEADGVPYAFDSGHETFTSPPSPLFISGEGLSASFNLSAGWHEIGLLIANSAPDASLGTNAYEYVGDFRFFGNVQPSIAPISTVFSPSAVADRAHVILGQSVSLDAAQGVLSNDTDPFPGDKLAVSAVDGQANNVGHALAGRFGTLTLSSDGSYTYVSTLTHQNEKTAVGWCRTRYVYLHDPRWHGRYGNDDIELHRY